MGDCLIVRGFDIFVSADFRSPVWRTSAGGSKNPLAFQVGGARFWRDYRVLIWTGVMPVILVVKRYARRCGRDAHVVNDWIFIVRWSKLSSCLYDVCWDRWPRVVLCRIFHCRQLDSHSSIGQLSGYSESKRDLMNAVSNWDNSFALHAGHLSQVCDAVPVARVLPTTAYIKSELSSATHDDCRSTDDSLLYCSSSANNYIGDDVDMRESHPQLKYLTICRNACCIHFVIQLHTPRSSFVTKRLLADFGWCRNEIHMLFMTALLSWLWWVNVSLWADLDLLPRGRDKTAGRGERATWQTSDLSCQIHGRQVTFLAKVEWGQTGVRQGHDDRGKEGIATCPL